MTLRSEGERFFPFLVFHCYSCPRVKASWQTACKSNNNTTNNLETEYFTWIVFECIIEDTLSHDKQRRTWTPGVSEGSTSSQHCNACLGRGSWDRRAQIVSVPRSRTPNSCWSLTNCSWCVYSSHPSCAAHWCFTCQAGPCTINCNYKFSTPAHEASFQPREQSDSSWQLCNSPRTFEAGGTQG